MSSSDVSNVTKFFATAAEGFTTTLASTIVSGATSVPLNSTTGLTNGNVFVGIIEPGATAQQVFTGTVDVGGAQITNVVWTRGSNTGHAGGVTIVDYSTGTARNMTTAGILKQHTQPGAHTGITTDTISTTGNATVGGTLAVTGAATHSGAVTNSSTTVLTGVVSGAGYSMLNMVNPYKFSVWCSTSDNLSTGVALKVPYNTREFDTGSNFDIATNHRFTAPIAGFYNFSAQVGIGAAGTGAVGNYIILYKNGLAVRSSQQIAGNATGTLLPRPTIVMQMQLAANDYIEVFAVCNEGGRTIDGQQAITFFSGFLVSAT